MHSHPFSITFAQEKVFLGMEGGRVLILGLGDSGLSMARWCQRMGAQVVVADTREHPPQLEALQKECPQAIFVSGTLEADLLHVHAIQSLWVSPGLRPRQTAKLWQAAKQRGVPCGGELDLFALALRALRVQKNYAPWVLAVTGTNGKTTTTSMTTFLLQESGKDAVMAGNIGPCLLDTLAARIDAANLPEIWVLELSSFQLHALQDSSGFHPTAAVILNVTQDHLDWHEDMKDYTASKVKIFARDTVVVLNRDDAAVMQMAPQPAPVVRRHKSVGSARCISFGYGLPSGPGQWGLETTHGMEWLVRAVDAEQQQGEFSIQRLMPSAVLRIQGKHNATNAMVALALAMECGCALPDLLRAVRFYSGEPHRVQSVGVVSDVEYIDDSKGTNVGATVAALYGLGVKRKLVVILGGEGKGQDFSPLGGALVSCARAVVLMGKDARLIEGQLRGALEALDVPVVHAVDMQDAVSKAAHLARAGDAVLLSPACSSLDMYANYVARAEAFVKAVSALQEGGGI